MSRPLFSVLGFLHKVDVCHCVVKKLELSSEYSGRYCKNSLSLKQLKTYFWQLKMVYCKVKMSSWELKMAYWQLKTIENELRSTRPNLIPLFATRCLYRGTSKLRSTGPNLVLCLGTRCLYWGCPYELRSTRPNFIPLLATRCLYQEWGIHLSSSQLDTTLYHSWPLDASIGVYLTKGQPDPKAEQMSSWLDIVPLLATRCLYQGVHLSSGQLNPT